MIWKLGDWQIYDEGEIHQKSKKCINILLDEGYSLSVILDEKTIALDHGKHLFEVLCDFEKSHGTNDLVEILTNGMWFEARKNGTIIKLRILLRQPSVSEDQARLFKDMVSHWVDESPLTFTERFFRLPKITEDPTDRYLDNPLEKALQRTFGFDFKYKLSIRAEHTSAEIEEIRRKIFKVLR